MKTLERFKLTRRREGWFLTWRGWLLAVAVMLGLATLVIRGAQPFLAVTRPVQTDLLTVEGWIPDFALRGALDEFRRGGYRQILVTGCPLEKGEPLSEYRTFAELGAAVLTKLGCPTNQLVAVPAPKVRHDRTFASALMLRRWLEQQGGVPPRLNVVTADAHARRTRLLFQQAFGDQTEIGIIAVPDERFDTSRWWRSSMGFRTVTGEIIAYIYARFLFSGPEEMADVAP